MKSCSLCLRKSLLCILFLFSADFRIISISQDLGMILFCFLKAGCSGAFLFTVSQNHAKNIRRAYFKLF